MSSIRPRRRTVFVGVASILAVAVVVSVRTGPSTLHVVGAVREAQASTVAPRSPKSVAAEPWNADASAGGTRPDAIH